jgi:DNA-binding XRE family transcriptional regulator
MAVAAANRLAVLRHKMGVTQKVMARLVGVTERTLIDLEGGRPLSEQVSRRMTEISRLHRELATVVSKVAIDRWLAEPNEAFDGDAPLDLIAKGKIDLLWNMIFELRSGTPS